MGGIEVNLLKVCCDAIDKAEASGEVDYWTEGVYKRKIVDIHVEAGEKSTTATMYPTKENNKSVRETDASDSIFTLMVPRRTK